MNLGQHRQSNDSGMVTVTLGLCADKVGLTVFSDLDRSTSTVLLTDSDIDALIDGLKDIRQKMTVRRMLG